MITHVAIRYDGKVFAMPKPHRHHDVIRLIVRETGAKTVDGEQGFLADGTTFLRRKPALTHAIECGQVERAAPTAPHAGLFSEDVW
jgi:hypothetical protein